MKNKPSLSLCRNLAALTLALSISLPATADDDFGIWTGVGVEKKLSKKFSVEGDLGFRAENKLKSATRWDVGLGVSYKPVKGIKISTGYTYIYARSLQEEKEKVKVIKEDDGKEKVILNGYNVDHGFWRSKHRYYFDVSGKLSAGRFTFSLRERYQYTKYPSTEYTREKFRVPVFDGHDGEKYTWAGNIFTSHEVTAEEKKSKSTHYLRSRVGVSYNIRHCPLEPFFTYEFSNNFSDGMHLDKKRLSVGSDFKISKQHKLSLAYLFQDGADDDDNNDIHVIEVGYKFNF